MTEEKTTDENDAAQAAAARWEQLRERALIEHGEFPNPNYDSAEDWQTAKVKALDRAEKRALAINTWAKQILSLLTDPPQFTVRGAEADAIELAKQAVLYVEAIQSELPGTATAFTPAIKGARNKFNTASPSRGGKVGTYAYICDRLAELKQQWVLTFEWELAARPLSTKHNTGNGATKCHSGGEGSAPAGITQSETATCSIGEWHLDTGAPSPYAGRTWKRGPNERCGGPYSMMSGREQVAHSLAIACAQLRWPLSSGRAESIEFTEDELKACRKALREWPEDEWKRGRGRSPKWEVLQQLLVAFGEPPKDWESMRKSVDKVRRTKSATAGTSRTQPRFDYIQQCQEPSEPGKTENEFPD